MSKEGALLYFIDSEFIDRGDGLPLLPLSIGVVAQDGREYYAEVAETDHALASPWVRDNVLKHMEGPVRFNHQIREELSAFVLDFHKSLDTTPVRFWGFYAAHDFVLLGDLFGGMRNLPEHFPHIVFDLEQEIRALGINKRDLPKPKGVKHHALEDARWHRDIHAFLAEKMNFDIVRRHWFMGQRAGSLQQS